jgi:hypothetical protein
MRLAIAALAMCNRPEERPAHRAQGSAAAARDPGVRHGALQRDADTWILAEEHADLVSAGIAQPSDGVSKYTCRS